MDIKELEKTVKDLVDAYNAVEHSPGGITVFNFIARGLQSAGYILPSSEMKLVEISENDVIRWAQENSFSRADVLKPSFYTGIINKRAQLLADQKAHDGMTKELIDAYEGMLDGMGLGQDNFKASDWQNVQDLKARYGG